MMLRKANNPPCPRCGCQDSEELRNTRWLDGKRKITRGCNHCGRTFSYRLDPDEGKVETDDNPPVVKFRERQLTAAGAECPVCGAFPCKVSSVPKHDGTSIRIRYHKCSQCGWKGKSQEVLAKRGG